MIYLLKFLLCSLLLYGFYHLILRNEVTFKFNRFYLLCIVLVAAVIPFTITNTRIVPVPMVKQPVVVQETTFSETELSIESMPPIPGDQNLTQWQVFLLIYVSITLFFIFRYFRNLYRINRLNRQAKPLMYKGMQLMLREDISETFSFMGTVYANQQQFESGQLPEAIIEHERAHINQKHSYDLLFFEFIACFLWFNPAIHLVRRAIKLNHEFLADRHVVQAMGGTGNYQNLLIHFASQRHLIKLPVVSHLTFGETKNRIKIMTKQSNNVSKVFKTTSAFIFIAALFVVLGSEKVVAQQVFQDQKTETAERQEATEQQETVERQETAESQDRPPPPPPVVVNLYSNAKVRFVDSDGKTITSLFKDLTDDQMKRFFDQGKRAEILIPPPPKAHLTQAMLKDFQNSKKYRLWIDGESKDNAELANYSLNDFHHFFKTRVSKSKRDQIEFDYFLDMTTTKKMDVFMEGRWIPMSQRFIPKPDEKNNDGMVMRRKNEN